MPRYVTKAASTLRRKAFRRLCHLAGNRLSVIGCCLRFLAKSSTSNRRGPDWKVARPPLSRKRGDPGLPGWLRARSRLSYMRPSSV